MIKNPGRYGTRTPGVGIAKIGTITFNPAAYEMMGDPKYLEMFHEYEGNRLFFKPTNDPGQHEVKVNRSGVQYRINSRKFIREYNIPPSDGKPYELEQMGEYYYMEHE